MLISCLNEVIPCDRVVNEEACTSLTSSHEVAKSASFDLVLLGDLFYGDQEVVRMLLTAFYFANEVDIVKFDELLLAARWRDLGHIVHRLRGSAQMIGARQLIDATRAFEVVLTQSVDMPPLVYLHVLAVSVREAVTLLQTTIKNLLDGDKLNSSSFSLQAGQNCKRK